MGWQGVGRSFTFGALHVRRIACGAACGRERQDLAPASHHSLQALQAAPTTYVVPCKRPDAASRGERPVELEGTACERRLASKRATSMFYLQAIAAGLTPRRRKEDLNRSCGALKNGSATKVCKQGLQRSPASKTYKQALQTSCAAAVNSRVRRRAPLVGGRQPLPRDQRRRIDAVAEPCVGARVALLRAGDRGRDPPRPAVAAGAGAEEVLVLDYAGRRPRRVGHRRGGLCSGGWGQQRDSGCKCILWAQGAVGTISVTARWAQVQ